MNPAPAEVVIDASTLSAIAFVEPEGAALVARLQSARLHAPRLLCYELTNVAWKKARHGRAEDAEGIRERLVDALSLHMALHEVDHPAVLSLALQHQLTAYDAAYLWLAQHLQIPLITLDGSLAEAASAEGLNGS